MLSVTTRFLHPLHSYLENSTIGAVVHIPGSADVALDQALADLWQSADGRTLLELQTDPRFCGRPWLVFELLAMGAASLLLPFPNPIPNLPSSLPTTLPLVSIVIVSRNGLHHLQELIPSLYEQTYPRIEIIIVDDRSTDGTFDYLRTNFSEVRIVTQSGGPNFAAGCNLGIHHSTGELIFVLNNDTVLDRHCVRELVASLAHQVNVAGVAAMLRFYANRPFINGLGTFVPSRGFGHDLAIGSLDLGQFDAIEQIPLLCFGAALLRRDAVDRVGFLDEAYQFYYEDADWSYRARALGFRLIAAPRAKVYHKFGASTGDLPSAFKLRLATRNRLRFTLKNLPANQVLSRLVTHLRDDLRDLIYFRQHSDLINAIVSAWREFLWGVPSILAYRSQTWRGRNRQPVNLVALAQSFPPPEMQATYPRLTQAAIDQRYRFDLARWCGEPMAQRLLIISPDVVNIHMGGVGMRYWELAHALADDARVTLATPGETALIGEKFSIQNYSPGNSDTLKPLVNAADILLLSGALMYHHPFLRAVPQYRVIDLYDPTVLENLERFSARPLAERGGLHNTELAITNELLARGDFFICASEKQRDYWLGALASVNRINPETYHADPTLRRLIDVVPFGIPNEPPQHTKSVLKGMYPGIAASDRVILWGGGLWDWLDPLTAIEAMPLVLQTVPNARLFFMGTKHPNPEVPPSRMAQRAIERATELGLKDRAIFFNDWTPYAVRANYLLEADLGISLHGDHIETRFSVRTRLMDYVWAALPMVITGGDTLSDQFAAQGLARIVSPGNVAQVAQSLIAMLQSPPDRVCFNAVAENFRWSRVAAPVARYVTAPWRNGETNNDIRVQRGGKPLWQLPGRALSVLRRRGVVGLWHAARAYVAWQNK